MRLLAISDLHLAVASNREALRALPSYPADWLLLAGDVCEKSDLFEEALAFLAGRFARVVWTPGNHELWLTERPGPGSSPAKYQALVAAARRCGVATPEDPYLPWPPTGEVVVPLFTGFDYSFRPADVSRAGVVRWAAERHCVSADEHLIRTTPYAGMEEWCATLCDAAEARMRKEIPPAARTILVGHYPLRQELVHIPRIPRFTPWCGTIRTADWHRRFRARGVVSGHLHTRRTDWHDGVRFDEVSLGYARQWDASRGMAAYLCDVTPRQNTAA
ncbi:Metallophosphoesterase [Rhodovastum atsumiense]|uniref:Metallophosphoesterase n=1 Tax=Rhodovastum atsumiense TaxID=504468 RepID=A0A5M6ISU7_9PROT|nr:metallophosphoesterase [Rhodovastum atsumiense]KAA5611390.1 metallophosphoesterase [Rhodovastum atsumiense]CAH2603601.1 Metallophosphoesterase [Rhodovastum atsumiense]